MGRIEAPDGWVDLAVGEPFFLQGVLWHAQAGLSSFDECLYPRWGGEPELLHELRHKYPGKHVIVTNGARQALVALATIWKGQRSGACKWKHLYDPFWPGFYDMACWAGLEESLPGDNSETGGSVFTCITVPNNPDGAIGWPAIKGGFNVFDAVYDHMLYGRPEGSEVPQHEAMVCSASKTLGLSGLRVGWVVTASQDLASRVADYVEETTSGVCVEAQRHVALVLRFLRLHPQAEKAMYSEARKRLLQNGECFLQILEKHLDEAKGLPDNGCGMFAWFRPRDPEAFDHACTQAMVAVARGNQFGSHLKQHDDWFRMNMGVTPATLGYALPSIVRHL